jgi:hypothetical protein
MSKLMSLVDEIKQKLTDNEYKLIVEEIALQEKSRNKFSKVKIAVPWVGKQLDVEDECTDNPITIKHEFITLILPTQYIGDYNVLLYNTYPLEELFMNSLNYDNQSFMNSIHTINIANIHIHNKTCIIIDIKNIDESGLG